MRVISLEESKYFQDEFYKISKTLKLATGEYVCGDTTLVVSGIISDTSCRYSYTLISVNGEVLYDSEKDYCDVVYGRYPIVLESLNKLKSLKSLIWEKEKFNAK